MKKKMTELFDDIPVEALEDIMQTEQREKKRSNGRYIPKWAAAMIAVCILGLVGCAGYVAINYADVFSKYFDGEDKKLPEELISDVRYQAENENYRIEVLSIMSDKEVKNILFSVEALNEKSWKNMEEKKLVPNVFINSSGGATWGEYEGLEEKWKKYYLYEGHFDEATEAKIICGVSESGEALNMYMSEEEIKEAGALTLTIPIDAKEDKMLTIWPKDAEFLEDAVLEKIEIFRMSIRLSGHGSGGNISCEEEKKIYPEIIVETDGKRKICLLGENEKKLSMKVDEVWDTGNCTEGFRSEEDKATECTQSIKFHQAFDIEKVTRVWVNGQEYPLK